MGHLDLSRYSVVCRGCGLHLPSGIEPLSRMGLSFQAFEGRAVRSVQDNETSQADKKSGTLHSESISLSFIWMMD